MSNCRTLFIHSTPIPTVDGVTANFYVFSSVRYVSEDPLLFSLDTYYLHPWSLRCKASTSETSDYLPLSHKHHVHRRNSTYATIFSAAAVNSQANITYSCNVVILYDIDGGTRPRFYDCEHLKPTYQPSEFFLVFRKPANEDVKTQLIVDAFNPL